MFLLSPSLLVPLCFFVPWKIQFSSFILSCESPTLFTQEKGARGEVSSWRQEIHKVLGAISYSLKSQAEVIFNKSSSCIDGSFPSSALT